LPPFIFSVFQFMLKWAYENYGICFPRVSIVNKLTPRHFPMELAPLGKQDGKWYNGSF